MQDLIKKFSQNWSYDSNQDDYHIESGKDFYKIILKNTCSWFKSNLGCSMCNYTSRNGMNATYVITHFEDRIIDELLNLNVRHSRVKLYINGSFFNEDELSFEVAVSFITRLKDLFEINVIQVESRPEYINRDLLIKYIDATKINFEVCFGVESASDVVRNTCLHKGISLQEVEFAIRNIRDLCHIKIYLLIKPPFLTESESISDILESVDYFMNIDVDYISCIPIAVQKNTLLEFMLQENIYRPIWLWSIVEINTRLKKKYGELLGTKIKITSFDYYPTPLATVFNCEKCTRKLNELMKSKGHITWDEIVALDYNCTCINIWKQTVSYIEGRTIQDRIEYAKKILEKNIVRTQEIYRNVDCNNDTKLLTDVAKQVPVNKSILDEVGIQNLFLPLKCNGISTSDAAISLSISLDEFHRGIHMSRLIEIATEFSLNVHDDLLVDMNEVLDNISINNGDCDARFLLKTNIYLTQHTPLTHKSCISMVPIELCILRKHNIKYISVKISIPIMNACPCTLITSRELLNKEITHTQRGNVSIEFIDCCQSLLDMMKIICRYSSILDLLKREDELNLVNSVFLSPNFCEDICRNIAQDLSSQIHQGKAVITVMTEESIHPHNAFAKKIIKF